MKFSNFKIKSKVLTLSVIILTFTLFIGLYNYREIKKTDNNYSSFLTDSLYCIGLLDTAKNDLNESRLMIRDYVRYIYTDNQQGIAEADAHLKESNPELLQAITDYHDFLTEYYPTETNQIKKTSDLMVEINDVFRAYCKDMYALALEGKGLEANTLLQESILPVSESIKKSLYEMYDWEMAYADDIMNTNSAATTKTGIISFIVLFVTILCGLFASTIISHSIANPITKLVDNAQEMSRGNFTLTLDTNRRDEVGSMTRSLGQVRDIMDSLSSDVHTMIKNFHGGDMTLNIDTSGYSGSYKALADAINGMINESIKDTQLLLECVNEFANGNFKADIPKFPGEKANMNNTIDSIRANLRAVGGDINELVRNAAKGNLSNRVAADNYKGDWATIMNELNGLMEVIAAPIHEASEVMHHLAAGNFDQKMNGQYEGDFLLIKTSINNTVTNIASYIDEISSVLESLAGKNLNQEIKRDYIGKFSNIKNALNNIIGSFNLIITEIFTAAEQVAAGSSQISESSMNLAQGASEQASAAEELSSMISNINDSAERNTENAEKAVSLSDKSKNNAAKGDDDMNQMLVAMEGIKDSSNSISHIIKVIDEIAFQTNLLALNAAVEAARAGEHGKGFAVVADEIRSLAGKSQSSAKKTAELIDESINRVNVGAKIASQTADALQTIIGDVSGVADLINEIAAASSEQASAIGHVTVGISQITEVVQANSATSEETASASQQLSSQSDMLQSMVGAFKLKEN